MRLQDSGFNTGELCDLLCHLGDLGIETFHSSTEYSSFPLFTDALRRLRRQRRSWRPVHIVKLAEPSFDEHDFEPARLRARITSYLGALDTDRLDVVQWMIRSDVNDTVRRMRIFDEAADTIGDTFDDLRSEGLIGAVVLFPYAAEDVEVAATSRFCDGAAVYFNLGEQAWRAGMDRMGSQGKGVVAIRPFGAGRAFVAMAALLEAPSAISWEELGWDSPAAACVGLPLLHPHVTTVIATVSTLRHASVASAGWQTRPNRSLFDQVLATARSAVTAINTSTGPGSPVSTTEP